MSWLRVDDGFTKHPKFEGWTVQQKWAWLECLEYCARYRTGGRIPNDLTLLPRSVTRTLLDRAETSGWIDTTDDGTRWIHGWEDFNPGRVEDIQGAVENAIAEHPTASANDLVRIVGGNRKQVLELIRRFRNGSNNGSEELVPTAVPELVTRARSRPVPSLEPVLAAAALDQQDPTNPAAAASITDRLDALGLGPDLLQEHGSSPELVNAWLDLAATEAKRNPAAFVLAGVRSGRLPSPRARVVPPVEELEPSERRSRFVATSGWRFTTEDLADELVVMGAEGDELVGLLERADVLRKQAAHA